MEQPKVLFGLCCSIHASVGPKVPSVILAFQFKRKKSTGQRDTSQRPPPRPRILCATTSLRANTT